MEETELEELAICHLARRMDGVEGLEPVIRICDSAEVEDEYEAMTYLQFHAVVLNKAADFVVFFDTEGRLLGWRDDGRLGAGGRTSGGRAECLAWAVFELDLPQETRVGKFESVELPPVGWTHEGVLFTASAPDPDQILRAFFSPETRKIIQWTAKGGIGDPVAAGEPMRARAAGFVEQALKRRLSVLTLTIGPEWHYLTRPQPAEPTPQGFQVRVETWRHWSDASVLLDPVDGWAIGDCIDRFAEPATTASLGQDTAIQVASNLFAVPQDAILRNFVSEPMADGHFVDTLEWRRYHDGLRVVGDFIELSVHPDSRRLIRYEDHWRPLEYDQAELAISETEAVELVEGQREALLIDEELEFESAELVFVPPDAAPEADQLAHRTRAWCITFSSDWGFVVVHIDAFSGRVIRVSRSA